MATKDAVLQALQNSEGAFLSGEELSNQLNVSRTTVWKAIKTLREEGHPIEAVTNRGYMLMADSWTITEDSLRACLPAKYKNLDLHIYDTIDSTNLKARQLATEGAPHGTVVMAKQQTSGRGRLGRSFFSPREGIYLSIVIKPDFDVSKSVLVTSAAAVAVANALEKVCGLDAKIKWVNDIYIEGKKVCGIITEGITDFETGQIEHLILGIGINTTVKDFPEELLETAGAAEGDYSKSTLAAEIIAQALNYIEDLDQASFMPDYKDKSLVIGKTITVYQGRYKVRPEDEIPGVPARVLDIADDGGLIVLYTDGSQEKLVSGEISIRL